VQVMPIDLTAIVAIVMVFSCALIPIAGITLRFAIKPAVEALVKAFDNRGLEDTVGVLERRLGLLEHQMDSIDSTVHRLAEALEFQNELQSGRTEEPLPLAGGDSS
jgi:hypothetical protein